MTQVLQALDHRVSIPDSLLSLSAEETFVLATIKRGVQGNRFCERDLSAEFDKLDWAEVLRVAFENRVASLLSYTLAPVFSSGRIPQKQLVILKKFFLETTQNNLRIRYNLNRIISELADRGIEVVILKGAALAYTIWPHMATRQMHDIDIVVPVEHVYETVDVLLDLGYQKTSGMMPIEWYLKHTKEFSLIEPKSGILVEVHYRFCSPNSRLKLPEASFWSNASSSFFGGISAKVLASEELFVYLCLHVSVGHFLKDNMRSLLDLKLLIESGGEGLDPLKIKAYLDDPSIGPLVAFPVEICSRYLEVDFKLLIEDSDSILARYYSGFYLKVLEKSAARFLLKVENDSFYDWILTRLSTALIYQHDISLVKLCSYFVLQQKGITQFREQQSPIEEVNTTLQRRAKLFWGLMKPKKRNVSKP
ncbi:MAG: hypothetical protein CBC31_007920 [Verrucomicrobia bacterium TMED71]|nr:MAG: hypothetical protein CBC31_007920 [Verrucomicrobia bacterium TMED71]